MQKEHAGIYLARENTPAESEMSCVCRPHLPSKDPGEVEIVEMRRAQKTRSWLGRICSLSMKTEEAWENTQ